MILFDLVTCRQYEVIARDSRASFEVDCEHRLVIDDESGTCTMEYESVIGQGNITEITDEDEKMRALGLVMEHYGREDMPVNRETAKRTRVLRLDVLSMTGKRRMKRG